MTWKGPNKKKKPVNFFPEILILVLAGKNIIMYDCSWKIVLKNPTTWALVIQLDSVSRENGKH